MVDGIMIYDPRLGQEYLYRTDLESTWSSLSHEALAIVLDGKRLVRDANLVTRLLSPQEAQLMAVQVVPFCCAKEWSEEPSKGFDFENLGSKSKFHGVGSQSKKNLEVVVNGVCICKDFEDWTVSYLPSHSRSEMEGVLRRENIPFYGPWVMMRYWKSLIFFAHFNLENYYASIFYKAEEQFDGLIDFLEGYCPSK